jgi:enoyl-CoA hydratase/carnithine racemase
VAAAADLKWLTNSASLLRRALRYTPAQAKWWGLVRLLVEELGLSLKAAADIATTALSATHSSSSALRASVDRSGSAALVVDLPRYQSIFLGNLSRALVHETPRRRGRVKQTATKDAVRAARDYGIDISLVRSALQRTPAERLALLEANAAFVRAMRRPAR